MPVVEREGHSIHYETHGDADAPPLLLIMGLGLSSRAWDKLPGRLTKDFRVVVFDNRGTGQSDSQRGFYRMDDFADDAAAVLRDVAKSRTRTKATGKTRTTSKRAAGAYVFGISMGGMIAQELTLRHPELVKSLVLGATFASWRKSHKPALRVALTLLGVNLAGSRFAKHLAPILVSAQFERDNPQEFRRWLLEVRKSESSAVFQQMGAIRNHSTIDRLDRITAPTLVITGTADQLVPPENSRVLHAAIRDARLHELPGAGHVFPFEREDETVHLLASHFLKKNR